MQAPPALRGAGARLAYNASMRVRAMRLASVILASALALAAPLPSLASDKKEVVLRGHVVCLDDAREALASGKDCPDDPPGGWAIRTKDRTLHRLSSQDVRVVMLTDLRVRSRELEIEAWQDGEGRLAIVRLRSVIDGRLHDPHFYCDVCSIRAHTPGPCWCCRAPFEFREPPLKE